MRQKIKNLKREFIVKIAQAIAEVFIVKLEESIKSKDEQSFTLYFDLSAKLNAYCIVFHDIYLD